MAPRERLRWINLENGNFAVVALYDLVAEVALDAALDCKHWHCQSCGRQRHLPGVRAGRAKMGPVRLYHGCLSHGQGRVQWRRAVGTCG